MESPILLFSDSSGVEPELFKLLSNPEILAKLGFTRVLFAQNSSEAFKYVHQAHMICIAFSEIHDSAFLADFSRSIRENEESFYKPLVAILPNLEFAEELKANGLDLIIEESIDKEEFLQKLEGFLNSKRNRTNLSYIYPFMQALQNIFDQKQMETTFTKPLYTYDLFQKWEDLSAIISFSGQCQGSLLLSMNEASARNVLEKIFGITQIHPAYLNDGVGELANQIVGNARKRLKEMGLSLSFSIPNIILGKEYEISRPHFENSVFTQATWKKGKLFLNLALKRNMDGEG